ncbi:hypothetical protein [Okeania sp. SIO1I7]|uniref:hypothetical protein n=1 Tax=Okeania sp. SIO1I7 TaxID=2607772 RepID=UPI0013FCDCD3|nr:hypothetical protein [Okeania sp. SIO1I7]NET29966.1 hypothetical protein [Okeania sp. SIO1I7]
MIINVLASGAIFVASSVAQEEIQVNYRSLKEFIGEKFGLITPIIQLERQPTEEKQKSLAKSLKYAIEVLPGTSQERENIINELLTKTKALGESLEKVPQKEFDIVGIDLNNVKAVNVKIGNIISEGEARVIGIKAEDSEFTNIIAGNITAKKK